MKQLLPAVFIAIFIGGCSATPAPEKPFHPTDSDALSTQGGKGEVGDGSEVDFGLDEAEVKPFHPTDALLIGGNGPFNAKPDAEDIGNMDLESNQ